MQTEEEIYILPPISQEKELENTILSSLEGSQTTYDSDDIESEYFQNKFIS